MGQDWPNGDEPACGKLAFQVLGALVAGAVVFVGGAVGALVWLLA